MPPKRSLFHEEGVVLEDVHVDTKYADDVGNPRSTTTFATSSGSPASGFGSTPRNPMTVQISDGTTTPAPTKSTSKRSIFDPPTTSHHPAQVPEHGGLNTSASGISIGFNVSRRTESNNNNSNSHINYNNSQFAIPAPAPAAPPAGPKKQVMMINTELSTGHAKTLKNTLGKKAVDGEDLGMSSSNTTGGGSNNQKQQNSGGGGAAGAEATATQNRNQIPRLSTLKKYPKSSKESMRIARTAYQFACMFCAFLAFALATSTVSSGYWVVRTDTTPPQSAGWYELTTFKGQCKCFPNFDFVCSNLNNAFEQVGQLSAVLLGSEFFLVGILLFEFSFYGIFGGPDYFTRLILIAGVLGIATAALTLTLYAMAWSSPYCSLLSFQDQGYVLGWSVYMRALEIVGLFVILVVTADSGFNSSRGPPCTVLFFSVLVLAGSFVTTTSYGWMTSEDQNTLYGISSYCTCGPTFACSTRDDYATLLDSNRAISAIQAVIGIMTVFFVILRAVDNSGATLKFGEISAAVFVMVGVVSIGNSYRLDFNAACNIPGQNDEYSRGFAIFVVGGASALMFVFVIMNGIYMTHFFVESIEKTILDHLPLDHPFYEWAQTREQREKEEREKLGGADSSFHNTPAFLKGILDRHKGHTAPSDARAIPTTQNANARRSSLTTAERYESGPFAVAGRRSFYQVFWWDELMSDGAIQADDIDDALQDHEEMRRGSTSKEDIANTDAVMVRKGTFFHAAKNSSSDLFSDDTSMNPMSPHKGGFTPRGVPQGKNYSGGGVPRGSVTTDEATPHGSQPRTSSFPGSPRETPRGGAAPPAGASTQPMTVFDV